MIGSIYDWAIATPADAAVALTSIVKRYDASIFLEVEAIRAGSFSGRTHIGSLAFGQVDLVPFHGYEVTTSPRPKADLDQIRSDIIAGKIAAKPTVAVSSATQSPTPAATTQAPT